jgi:hypothetical protein
MDRTAERLLHQIEAIEENADAAQPAGAGKVQCRETNKVGVA